ncbi:magnesium and cobalt efflux protein CorC-like [Sycon ciliatum]|uniref:magnesium and cobalt efflux protein CorC-like n=1 Tax=Sycon ciliatum TaxID=27933 RepID=UPI0031F62F6A
MLKRIRALLRGHKDVNDPSHLSHHKGQNGGELPPSTSLIVREIQATLYRFGETTVKEIMIPRVDVVGIPVDYPIRDIADFVSEHGHSRFPVYEESIDHVLGILHAKDLLRLIRTPEKPPPLTEFLRKATFVPELKRIDDMLVSLKALHTHIAIVMDEYGGVAGLITLEDILEELVGEIRDEYDNEEESITPIGENLYRVSARTHIEDLGNHLGITFDNTENDSIGGYVQHMLGRAPQLSDEVSVHNFRFRVESMDGTKLQWLRVIRELENHPPSEAGANT